MEQQDKEREVDFERKQLSVDLEYRAMVERGRRVDEKIGRVIEEHEAGLNKLSSQRPPILIDEGPLKGYQDQILSLEKKFKATKRVTKPSEI